MTKRTPEEVERLVIERWYQGYTRDDIASEFGIGKPTVSRIIKVHADGASANDVEAAREFAIQAKKNKITIPDCVVGARIAAVLNHLGIADDDDVYKFLARLAMEINDRVTPAKARKAFLDMVELSETEGIPMVQVPSFLRQSQEETKKIQEDINSLNETKQVAEVEAHLAGVARDQALQGRDVTLETLDNYVQTKNELANHDLSMDDLPKAVLVLKTIKEHESGEKLIAELLETMALGERKRALLEEVKGLEQKQKRVAELDEQIRRLNREENALQTRIGILHSDSMSKIVSFNEKVDESIKRFESAVSLSEKSLNDFGRGVITLSSDIIQELNASRKANQDYVEKAKAIENLTPLFQAMQGSKVPLKEYARALYYALGPSLQITPKGTSMLVHASHLHNELRLYLIKEGVYV